MGIEHESSCPLPSEGDSRRITLAHGEGGRLMRRLLRDTLLPPLANDHLLQCGDAAVLPRPNGRLAMTTDSFVVSPLFFPGGDIGSLAVYGSVNDLVVSGARPCWLSLALIIEEGLELDVLTRVMQSVAAAARDVNVPVVCGDTKVVPRGAADRLFINTTGVGVFSDAPWPGPSCLEVGDEILVSGPIGRHGMAVMTSREGLEFDPPPTSDSAPLSEPVAAIQAERIPVRAMRDATRGGLAAVLHEWAESSKLTLAVVERQIPVTPDVRGVCEILGLDPIHVANEGTMVIAVPRDVADQTLQVLRGSPVSRGAARIGQVTERGLAPVVVQRALGNPLPLDELVGAPLPRIC